jgi:hypothetical protein
MTDIVIGGIAAKPKTAASSWIALAILMLLGLWSDVATIERSEACGALVWGQSKWDGCDIFMPAR